MTTAAFKRLRADVFKRADESCECGCGRFITPETGHLDHFFGRARHESLQTCWALSVECDRARTDNHPDAATWADRFYLHAIKHGYHEAAEMAVARIRVLVAKKLAS